MKNETMFYLRDTRNNVGSNCLFWAIDGKGYTTNLEDAWRINKKQAQSYCDSRETDIPLSESDVDNLAVRRVDMQYLGRDGYSSRSKTNQYIVRSGTDYNGNDIYFETENGRSLDMREAKIYTLESMPLSETVYPLEFIESITRSTFLAKDVNVRRMTQNSGIKYKAPRKQKPTTGKTRGNCSECGRIAWDDNPYEQPQCSDECLDKHLDNQRLVRGY